MVVSMLATCTAIFVSAVDNTDTPYTFSFNTNAKYTVGRLKTDDSSCYMKYSSGSISYTAKAYGKTTVNTSTHYDRSGGFVYRFTSAHQARFMYNYVYEKSHGSTAVYPIAPYISIQGAATGSGTAAGLWSPDSVYEAGVLPPSDYMK